MQQAAAHNTVSPLEAVHGRIDVSRFYSLHFLGAVFPMCAALLLYGWRALVVMASVCVTVTAAVAVWRRIGSRGWQLNYSHALWSAMLLSLMLPANLATLAPRDGVAVWPLLPAAGVLLVIFLWLTGGLGAGRIHPILITYLLLVIIFQDFLVPHSVLQRHRLFAGDVLDTGTAASVSASSEPWVSRPIVTGHDAQTADLAARHLMFYTSGTEKPERDLLPLQGLIRDRMPPLEDFIIGGQPGPIGASSAIAVIIGGLFLLYRGVIDYRIPLLITLVAFAGLLILPIPVAITDRGPQWWWLAVRQSGVGWATAVTLANYELTASPALFTAFFLATPNTVTPMSRRARTFYAVLTGALTAVFLLYLNSSVSFGPYLALLLASLLSPTLDKVFHPKPLV